MKMTQRQSSLPSSLGVALTWVGCILVQVLLLLSTRRCCSAEVVASSTTTTTTNTKNRCVMVIDVRDPHIQDNIPTMIAIQVCVGLFNQDETVAGAAYTLWEESDKIWVTEILEPDPTVERIPLAVDAFLSKCLNTVAHGRFIDYDYYHHRIIIPNLITLASVLHAVPLVAELQTSLIQMPQQINAAKIRGGRHHDDHNTTIHYEYEKVFDVEMEWKGYTAYDATKYMFHHYAHRTTTMSIMNPGYDNRIDDDDPNAKSTGEKTDIHGSPLTVNPNLRWADLVVKEHLFNFYLPKGCFRLTMEHALMEEMVNPKNSPWPQPIAVYGYNDVKLGPAYLFESETNCVGHHNMGQIATETNNLAFWSRKPPIMEPLLQPYHHYNNQQQQQPPPPTAQSTTQEGSTTTTATKTADTYDPSKTYIAFVIGDGDNVNFVKNRNYKWVQKRVDYCQNQTIAEKYRCFPLSWSISPHLIHLGPDILKWYYEQAQLTQQDYFLLPPSGYTYSYPAMMSPEFQDEFVAQTEEAAWLLNTTGSVDWEFVFTWRHAINKFFPRYAASTSTHKIRGLFPVNVPFNFPVFMFGRHEYYKLIQAPNNGNGQQPVVLFHPREWRGTSGHSVRVFLSKAENLRPDQMAAEINGYPKGTVSYIYLTSDDHCDLDSLYELVPQLHQHVQVVNHEVLIDMALQRG